MKKKEPRTREALETERDPMPHRKARESTGESAYRDGRMAVNFPAEGITLALRVTQLGERRYRLDEAPIGVEGPGFRDHIEAELTERGGLRFLRVLQRSGWRTIEFLLPSGAAASERVESLLARVEELGGHWEPFLPERLRLCLPPERELDDDPAPRWGATIPA